MRALSFYLLAKRDSICYNKSGHIRAVCKREIPMDKLVLIDGNSLLNRAFYATKLLTTKDGTPTNAVFGFTKLLLKLISDLKPDRLIVAFDLKAPTFRHKMYDGYKATRKPMPDDLAVQVGMLKSLLRSMNISMCEKEGFEADDLVGTLSHAFADMHSVIITGDKDSYQLVDDRTDVYITKTGVSDLLKLTAANFRATVGYDPCRVIDMKALMGDSSDNIPGVPGIGEKTAFRLVTSYGDLDSVYAHISELEPGLQKKLEGGRESAYLSRTLATIDRNVPLEIAEGMGKLSMPFSEEVRTQFLQLEFTSLLKEKIFEEKVPGSAAIKQEAAPERTEVRSAEEFLKAFGTPARFSAAYTDDKFFFCAENREYVLSVSRTLINEGVSVADAVFVLKEVFGRTGATVLLYGKKDFCHILRRLGVTFACTAEDVSLIKYLVDYTGKDDKLTAALQEYGLPEDLPAYGINCLYDTLYGKLTDEGMLSLYRDVELPLADVLYDMETEGVKVDRTASVQFEKRYRAEIEQATSDIYEAAGEKFNISSPLQLGKILFEKLGLPAPKKGKKGAYTTNAEVLEKLAGQYKIVRDVLRCRHFQKLLSTYIDGFRPLIEPGTDLVHTTYNQVLTTTGRLSSVNPNLQNIPVRDDDGRELRKLFIARGEDRVLIDADYSQIELRLLAHFSGCKELIEAYNEGMDIHALTASQVFGVPLGEVTPAQRRAAKAVNFGIIYGISEFGLANNLDIGTKEAGEYIRKYFERYSDVKKYMDSNVAFAREHGYVTTLLGRKRVIAEIRSSNYNIRSFGERAAMNMPLQGSSADIIKVAMVRIAHRLKEGGFRSKLILQVHDELVIDAFLDEQEEVSAILKYEMEHAASLKVPLVAEVHSGRSWYEAK